MQNFSYRGRDAKGAPVTGHILALSKDNAISKLQEKEIVLLALTQEKEKSENKSSLSMELKFKRKITPDDVILLTRQLYSLAKSGIPIVRAITGLAESTDNETLAEVLKDVAQSLIAGAELSTAFRQHPKYFSPIFVSLISVGESTGRLDEAFTKLTQHLEMERETRKQIKSATRYPIMVITSITVAMIVINVFVIPNFSGVFAKLGADLPWATQVLMATSSFMINQWHVLLIIIVTSLLAWYHYIKTESGEVWWHQKKLRIPLIGSIFERIALARFSRSFAMMLSSGVPILRALSVVGDTVGNQYIANAILGMQKGVERGERLTATASNTQLFTPLVLQMMAVGEETGSVDELLNEVADFYEQEVEYELKRLADAIEPILLVFMGFLVLMLALGVFLPIWELSTTTQAAR